MHNGAPFTDRQKKNMTELRARRKRGPMDRYRVYFRSQWGAIIGREEFIAANDAAAVGIAKSAWEASSDICYSYDLWQGCRQVIVLPNIEAMSIAAQESALDLEERLLKSQWAIAKSQRLLERARRLAAS
jgi:hypothetical protein